MAVIFVTLHRNLTTFGPVK